MTMQLLNPGSPVPLVTPPCYHVPFSTLPRRSRTTFSAATARTCGLLPVSQTQNSISSSSSSSCDAAAQSLVCSTVVPPAIQRSRIQPSPELGLASLLFVLSMAIGSIFSLAIASLPLMPAFKKLGISARKLSHVVSEEVPGTLSSFKLSGMEINELTQQLSNLRQKIYGTRQGNKGRRVGESPLLSELAATLM